MENEKRLDLIDRNELKKMVHLSGHGMYYDAYEVQEMPTVDAVEVVHGRWEHYRTGCYFNVKCTACGVNAISVNTTFFGCLPTVSWNYCPNCGAKMDGDGNG